MGSATTTIDTTTEPEEYDRRKELQEFEDTKLGVKGLVDSGITQIPRIFHHPPEPHSLPESDPNEDPIPMIDLSDLESDLAGRIKDAAAKFGFFQVVNHGIPVSLLDRLIAGVRDFHELPAPEKRRYYQRAPGVSFFSNVDLFLSKAATWRDTLQIRLSPKPVDPPTIPDSCRDEVIEWDREVRQLGERLLALLSQGLGVDASKVKDMSCSEGRLMVAHYYPYCPEPDKTLGIGCHSDPGLLTVLLQDQAGGLQVKHHHKWVEVKPVHGALVINIGNLLQMISNDQYTSAEHRVLANSYQEPRVSIAVFFNPSIRENLYGPLPELVSTEKPASYRQFTYSEYITKFFTKELDGKSILNYFRLHN